MRKRKESLYLSRLSRCLGSTSPLCGGFRFFFYSRKEKSVSLLANNVSIRFDSREIRRESGMRNDVLRKEQHHQQLWAQNDLSSKVKEKTTTRRRRRRRERERAFSHRYVRRVKEFYGNNNERRARWIYERCNGIQKEGGHVLV